LACLSTTPRSSGFQDARGRGKGLKTRGWFGGFERVLHPRFTASAFIIPLHMYIGLSHLAGGFGVGVWVAM
jgi:hypothetical protein